MADNITAGGFVFATREIGGVHFMQMKIAFGPAGVATEVSGDNPFPVAAADVVTAIGALGAKIDDMNASLNAIEASATSSAPAGVTRAGAILDYAKLSNAQLAASVGLPAAPAGTKSIILIAEGQTVRFNPEGDATATDLPIIAGQPGYEFPLPGGAARFIRAADGATLHILFIGAP